MFGFVSKKKHLEDMREFCGRISDLEKLLEIVISMNNSEKVELKDVFTWFNLDRKKGIVFKYFDGIKPKEIILMSGENLDMKEYSIDHDIIKIVREDGYVHVFEVNRRKRTSTDLTKILESIEKWNKVTT